MTSATTCPKCGSDDLMFGVDEEDNEDGTFVCESCDYEGGVEYWTVNVVLPDGLQQTLGHHAGTSGIHPTSGPWFVDEAIDNVGVTMRVFGFDAEDMEQKLVPVLGDVFGDHAVEWIIDDYQVLTVS